MTRHLLLCALLVGCGLIRNPDPTPVSDASFPHPDAYDEAAKHGADALSDGAQCARCHTGVDEPAGAPTCSSCHATYPHPTGFRAGERHGEGLIDDSVAQEPCFACHETEGLKAAEQVGCSSCHSMYPHNRDWKRAHGAWAVGLGDPVASCGSCHGLDLLGARTQVSCDECHSGWPHTPDWKRGTAHGAAWKADYRSCAGCHGADGSGGSSEVACAQCHDSYPHTLDWKTGHLQVAAKVGEPPCMVCHSPGDGPKTMISSCGASCHGEGR